MATRIGDRGVYSEDVEARLGYMVYDADHHIYAPIDARTRHLAEKFHDQVPEIMIDNPAEVEGDHGEHVIETIGTHTVPDGGFAGVDLSQLPGMGDGIPIPGAMLSKLNPMKDLDQLSRIELVERYQEMRPSFEKKEPRLKLMDLQGIEAAVVHTSGFDYEPAFHHGLDVGAAVTRAWNEYILEDWGFATDGRIFCPLMVPFEDVDLAVREIEWGLDHGARFINLPVGPNPNHTSPFDPMYDPVWSLVGESGLRVACHLHDTARHDGMAAWGEDPTTDYPHYDAFQWVLFWSDRPVMEMVTAMIFHNLFGRFPKVRVLLAEFGTVWLPYLLRKLDHAAALGRTSTFGELPDRPSEIFKRHVLVAPYPEERIERVAETSGWDCLVFGSDFPHSEGLPDPIQYVQMLSEVDPNAKYQVMRGNLEKFING